MRPARYLALLGLPLAFVGCAAVPPSGPSVYALPAQGKNLQAFQGEDLSCRNYAQNAVGPAVAQQQQANNAAVGTAAAGTALGAAAGALIGSAGAAAGAGAAVGAGVGLLAGSAIGANQAQASSYGLQERYDVAYAQCMASNGNSVQAPPPRVVAYPAYPGYYGYPYPYYGPTVAFGYYGGYGRYYRRY